MNSRWTYDPERKGDGNEPKVDGTPYSRVLVNRCWRNIRSHDVEGWRSRSTDDDTNRSRNGFKCKVRGKPKLEGENMDKVAQAFQLIKGSYVEDVKEKQLVEGAIQGMLTTLDDPYSVYMDEETAKQFSDMLDSSFEGIGAEVSMIDGKTIIVAPFKASPAEKAGIKPNDQILSVDGVSVDGLDLYETTLKIRGKKELWSCWKLCGKD